MEKVLLGPQHHDPKSLPAAIPTGTSAARERGV